MYVNVRNIFICPPISLNFILEILSHNNSELNQVMALCQTGTKPLPEPTLTQLTDAYLHLQASMIYLMKCLNIRQHFESHLPLDKIATILQKIFSDAFAWMKSFAFWLKFHWTLFLRVQLTISQPIRRQAIIWTNSEPVHWRIYVALGGDELNHVFDQQYCTHKSSDIYTWSFDLQMFWTSNSRFLHQSTKWLCRWHCLSFM